MILNTQIYPHDVKELAEKYDKAKDQIDDIPIYEVFAFRKLINFQFAEISKKIDFIFVDYEPYGENPTIVDMLKDFRKGQLFIHVTGNESKIWGKFHNLQFRAIHDFIHCMAEKDFTHKDECSIYTMQCSFSLQEKYTEAVPYVNWQRYTEVLRSEIVYQSAYKEIDGKFHIDQKIILDDLIIPMEMN